MAKNMDVRANAHPWVGSEVLILDDRIVICGMDEYGNGSSVAFTHDAATLILARLHLWDKAKRAEGGMSKAFEAWLAENNLRIDGMGHGEIAKAAWQAATNRAIAIIRDHYTDTTAEYPMVWGMFLELREKIRSDE